MKKARLWFEQTETTRQKARGSGLRQAALYQQSPTTNWAYIDRRGVKANFTVPTKSARSAAIRSRRPGAPRKRTRSTTAESPPTPFSKQRVDSTSCCKETRMSGRSSRWSMASRTRHFILAKVHDTKESVVFSASQLAIHIGSVKDVGKEIVLIVDKEDNYRLSAPLKTLRWNPKKGDELRADIGVPRGDTGQTTQRVYWSNKATAITADVPSEAELTPKLCGKRKIVGD